MVGNYCPQIPQMTQIKELLFFDPRNLRNLRLTTAKHRSPVRTRVLKDA